MTSQPLHPARDNLFILQSASRWRPAHKSTLLTATNIAQHYIPNVTAAPTFPILFSKNPFFKFFGGALSRGPGGFCPSFSNSPTPPQYPLIFSQLSTSIHTSFFTVLPNGLTARSYVLLALHQGVLNLWARAIHGPHSPFAAMEPNLHRHPIRPDSTPSLASVQSPCLDIPRVILLSGWV